MGIFFIFFIPATILPSETGRPIPAISLIQISSAPGLDKLLGHVYIIFHGMYREKVMHREHFQEIMPASRA